MKIEDIMRRLRATVAVSPTEAMRIVGDRDTDEDNHPRATRYIQGRLGGESRGTAKPDTISRPARFSSLPRR
jgi:hypothetical protein